MYNRQFIIIAVNTNCYLDQRWIAVVTSAVAVAAIVSTRCRNEARRLASRSDASRIPPHRALQVVRPEQRQEQADEDVQNHWTLSAPETSLWSTLTVRPL